MEKRLTKSLSTAGRNLVSEASTIPEILSIEHVSSATRLLEKRRQMFEVQDALDLQKEEYARQEVRTSAGYALGLMNSICRTPSRDAKKCCDEKI